MIQYINNTYVSLIMLFFLNGDFIRASQELETKETTGDYKYEQAVTGSVVQFNQHGLQFLLLWEIHKWEKSFISSPTKSFLGGLESKHNLLRRFQIAHKVVWTTASKIRADLVGKFVLSAHLIKDGRSLG